MANAAVETGRSAEDNKAMRAKLEFGVWRKAFLRSHAAWSNAPNDLKPPLLLTGQALARAESWLFAFPEKLSDGEKRFIVRSLAESSRRSTGRLPSVARSITKRNTGGILVAVIAYAVALVLYAPDFLRGAIDTSINGRAMEHPAFKNQSAHERNKPDPDAAGDLANADPTDPDATAASATEATDAAHDEAAADAPRPAAAPAPPPVSMSPLAKLYRAQYEKGDTRTALLLAVEASHDGTGAGSPEKSAADQIEATGYAAALIARRLEKTVATGVQPVPLSAGSPALFCGKAGSPYYVALTASEGGIVQIWRTDLGRKIAELTDRTHLLRGAALDRACERVVLVGEEHTAEIWSLASGKRLVELAGHEATVLATTFSPDGRTVVTAGQDAAVKLWDATTGRLRATLAGHDDFVFDAAFSADGRRLVTASQDKTARIWDVGSGREIKALTGHQGYVVSTRFSQDGRSVLTVSWDGSAGVWNAQTGERRAAFMTAGAGMMSAIISPDGTRVVGLDHDGAAQIYDATTGKAITEIADTHGAIRSIAFGHDGRTILAATWDGHAVLFNAVTGRLISKLNGTTQAVDSVAFGADGSTASARLRDGAIVTWPLLDGLVAVTARAKEIAGGCLSAEEREALGLTRESPSWCDAVALPQAAARVLPDTAPKPVPSAGKSSSVGAMVPTSAAP